MKFPISPALSFRIAMLGSAAALAACQPSADTATDGATEDEVVADESLPMALTTADLKTADGKDVGTVSLSTAGDGLSLVLTVSDMEPGEHGVHIHQTGDCTAPDFTSAGGHWNPTGKMHGLDAEKGSHMGDLPNLVVGEDGTGMLEATIAGASLEGGDNPLLDDDGAAFIVHAGPDDQVTDPSGDSGSRVACGVFATAS